jgi:hypothetical protein
MIFFGSGNMNKTVKEMREEDFLKQQFIVNRGFQYFMIWGHEWIEKKEEFKTKLREVISEIEK